MIGERQGGGVGTVEPDAGDHQEEARQDAGQTDAERYRGQKEEAPGRRNAEAGHQQAPRSHPSDQPTTDLSQQQNAHGVGPEDQAEGLGGDPIDDLDTNGAPET